MWKKENEFPQQPEPAATPAPPRSTSSSSSNPVESRKEGATIGPSISIKGDLTGGEDLIIQGQVEGKIDLKQNNVTVGKSGRIKADIYGRLITIEGEVEGNLYGEEQILLRQSGSVRGNIVAPRVSLEDGSKFKGSIDMEPKSAEKLRPQSVMAESRRSDAPQKGEMASEQAAKGAAPFKTESSTSRT
jgi:cytoskeletal protein CcmA (bactofilin family)